jgi:hypothetical protein
MILQKMSLVKQLYQASCLLKQVKKVKEIINILVISKYVNQLMPMSFQSITRILKIHLKHLSNDIN